jgi:DNA repair photolyase
VNVAPIIPGLNDEEMGEILTAARSAGAKHAGAVLLRLPGAVLPVFEERLRAALPLRAERVLRRIRETRGGSMNDSTFGARGRGTGVYAETLFALFERTATRLGLETRFMDAPKPEAPSTTFERPVTSSAQLPLFR